jgi:nitrite reductase/ring-hydroxylating ferredoxin subunit
VEFHLPIKDTQKAQRVGAAYRALYERLWDEDEEMMVQRQQYLARRPKPDRDPVRVGSIREVASKLPLTIALGDERFRIVEVDGAYFAHSVICPHLQGPLDSEPMDGGEITCPWHGYRYDVRTGRSCDGRNLKMRPAPSVVTDTERDEIRLEWKKPQVAGRSG